MYYEQPCGNSETWFEDLFHSGKEHCVHEVSSADILAAIKDYRNTVYGWGEEVYTF